MPTDSALARRVRQDEGGFTLVELLVGLTIGVIVVFAGYTALDATNRSQLSTLNRVEAINRGRNGMEAISRVVRSQQCFNGARPMLWASSTGMEFYSSVAPGPTTAMEKQPVQRHRIEWRVGDVNETKDIGTGTTPAGTIGDITHTVWNGQTNQDGTITFPATAAPVSRNVIARGVQATNDRRDPTKIAPMFRYFKYASTTGSGRVDVTAPVEMKAIPADARLNPQNLASAVSTDLAGIVLIEVSYQSVPRKTRVAPTKALKFHNTISVRIADPTNPAGSPQCL